MKTDENKLELLREWVPMQQRRLTSGSTVYQAGETFVCLHIIRSGNVKVVNLSRDGREQVVAVRGPGDWLGFGCIGRKYHECDAVVLDDAEIWSMRYEAFLKAARSHSELLVAMHVAMSREMAFIRDSLTLLCTLPADARVAEFLRLQLTNQARLGLHTDRITLGMTRAEIANHLGMRLESVSRALSRLVREGLIRFPQFGGREVCIPDADGLFRFVHASVPASSVATGH